MTASSEPSRKQLRARLTRQRQSLDARQRMQAALGVRRSLEQLPEFLVDTRVAGYWAHAGELPLNLVMASLAEREQPFLLPVLGEGRAMRFASWRTGENVQANRYGIPEPIETAHSLSGEELDLVLVPLLGFDRHGHRLGFGGGFYDACFTFLNERPRPASPLLVGIAYAFQELPAIAPQSWDVRMDYIATEHELIDCNASGGAG